jgi:hypothetical protein
MPIHQSKEPLDQRFEAFSRRLESRTRDFAALGEIPEESKRFLEERRKRREEIERKIASAIQRGAIWDIIKYELQRDFGSLSETFLLWSQGLERNSAKGGR